MKYYYRVMLGCKSIHAAEYFAGQVIGEDALRVLREIIQLRARILTDIAAELSHIRTATKWATPLAKHTGHSHTQPKG